MTSDQLGFAGFGSILQQAKISLLLPSLHPQTHALTLLRNSISTSLTTLST